MYTLSNFKLYSSLYVGVIPQPSSLTKRHIVEFSWKSNGNHETNPFNYLSIYKIRMIHLSPPTILFPDVSRSRSWDRESSANQPGLIVEQDHEAVPFASVK